MTVKSICESLSWNVSELARQAGITWLAANNAWNKKRVQPRTKRDIVAAFQEAGKVVEVFDIDWE